MKKFVRKLIAILRLNKRIVCEESKSRGVYDFHDYSDSTIEWPLHFHIHTCKRCGKKFII